MTVLAPLNLALALSAIQDGRKIVASGQVDAGLRLIGYGGDYLETFLPKIDARLAAQVAVAADNLKCKAGAA